MDQGAKKDGHSIVTLQDDGRGVQVFVHRLVLLAFQGPSDLTVNHMDWTPWNNRLENLEYCTVTENLVHQSHPARKQGGSLSAQGLTPRTERGKRGSGGR
jgi:hypothetical protein